MTLRRTLACAASLALLLQALATTASASADSRAVIAAGPEGGSYYFIAGSLRTELVLRNELLPVLQLTAGSAENLQRLQSPDSEVNVALAQADALHAFLQQNQQFRDQFFVLGEMGRECLVIIARSDGPRTASDLKRAGGGLAVGSSGSGAAVTWAAMTALEPGFNASAPIYDPVLQALLELRNGDVGERLRAAMLVQRPSRETRPLRVALDAPDIYRFVPVLAGDLPSATRARLPDGKAVYSFEEVALGARSRGQRPRVATLCTRALLLGSRTKLGPTLRDTLAEVMLEAGERIARSTPLSK